DSILSLVFKLVQSAQKRWQRIRGFKHLGDVIEGISFQNGIRVEQKIQTTTNQKAA
ncbi:MAG: IS256 family transposase, partial [Cyanobacteria bacterium J06627_3]